MDEGLLMHVGSSSYTQSTCQSESSSQTPLSSGAGAQEEGGANQKSEYCKDLLMRGRTEFSFEELRAERYNQLQPKKRRHLEELSERLSLELEEKKKLLLLRRSQRQVVSEGPASQITDSGPAATSFQIYDESQSAAAARPAGKELPDDVFLHPDERGLCLKIQHPQPGAVGSSERSQTDDGILSGLQDQNISAPQNHLHLNASDHRRGPTKDPQTVMESRPQIVPQKPELKSINELSPIQETSVEMNSLTSQGGCSPLNEDQEETEDAPPAAAGDVDPCDAAVRRQLLALCDVTSSPDLHSEACPLPPVEENTFVQLGGDEYFILSRVVDGGSFSIYVGATDDNCVRIKVDSCSVPWDFHQFQRLKKNWPTADGLPLISCFLFLDGCITVYTAPTCDHKFAELTECVPNEVLVGCRAVGLLDLVSALHSCRLLHAALQPNVFVWSRRSFPGLDCFFPVDWSSSLDLDLQRDVTSVQQVPSAQSYISLGLLEPNDPPQLVDLVGLAETVHLLLTNSRLVAIKDDEGWTAEKFSGDEPCDMYSRMWRRFFRSLLNAGRRSSSSVLLALKEQLWRLYQGPY